MIKSMHDTIAEAMRRMKSVRYWDLIPNMTPAEVYLLAAICNENRISKKVSDLCDSCDMQPTAVSRLMNGLEDKGLIVRTVGKEDRRVTEVEATALGYQTDNDNREILQDYWSRVLKNVPQDDVDTMLSIMNEIVDSMERVLTEKIYDRKRESH